MLLRSVEVLAVMQERGELAAALLVGDEGVRLEDRFEPVHGVAAPVRDLGELFEVAGDLSFMPGEQNRFDAGKYL